MQFFQTLFPNFTLQTVSTNEIMNTISSLKSKNSSGYDGISTKLIKKSSPFFASPLTHICNKSITSGIFPECMKYAIVNPLFKKVKKTELTNYRPISILSSFSKIIEKVIYKQLLNHLNKHNILVQ